MIMRGTDQERGWPPVENPNIPAASYPFGINVAAGVTAALRTRGVDMAWRHTSPVVSAQHSGTAKPNAVSAKQASPPRGPI